MIYHKHHIVPKHMGGTNDPSNIVSLTVEEHALAHKKLWEESGCEEDKIAWLCLSGQITNAEAIILAVKKANTGRKLIFSEEHKKNLSKSRKKQSPPRLGMKASDETKKKMSEARKKRWQNEDYRNIMSDRMKGEKNPMYGKAPYNKRIKEDVK